MYFGVLAAVDFALRRGVPRPSPDDLGRSSWEMPRAPLEGARSFDGDVVRIAHRTHESSSTTAAKAAHTRRVRRLPSGHRDDGSCAGPARALRSRRRLARFERGRRHAEDRPSRAHVAAAPPRGVHASSFKRRDRRSGRAERDGGVARPPPRRRARLGDASRCEAFRSKLRSPARSRLARANSAYSSTSRSASRVQIRYASASTRGGLAGSR